MMPLAKDPAGATRENPHYCSLCFSGGHLRADEVRDLAEFQAEAYAGMRRRGLSWIAARFFAYCIRFAPYWRERRRR
jgi:hypothetical protein